MEVEKSESELGPVFDLSEDIQIAFYNIDYYSLSDAEKNGAVHGHVIVGLYGLDGLHDLSGIVRAVNICAGRDSGITCVVKSTDGNYYNLDDVIEAHQ